MMEQLSLPLTANAAIALTLFLTALTTLITSIEQLLRYRDLALFFVFDVGDAHMRRRLLAGLLIIRSLSAFWLMVTILLGQLAPAALVVLAGSSLALGAMRPVGGDGADQIQLICITAAALCFLVLPPAKAAVWSNVYIAFQLLVAYATTGWAKLASPTWRSGIVLSKIMATRTYGHPRVAATLAANPALDRATSWGPMLLFSVAPILMLQPSVPVLAGFLVLAFLFHLGTGVLMGLNNFVLAFPATFPSVIYAHSLLYG